MVAAGCPGGPSLEVPMPVIKVKAFSTPSTSSTLLEIGMALRDGFQLVPLAPLLVGGPCTIRAALR